MRDRRTVPHAGDRAAVASARGHRPTTELADIPWLACSTRDERARASTTCRSCEVAAGRAAVPHRPARPTYWFGVVDGLLKMSNDNSHGHPDHLHRPAAGRLVRRRHGAQARGLPLQHPGRCARSVVAGLPSRRSTGCSTRSIPFNRFVMNQLNERLGAVHRGARDRPHERSRRARGAQPGGAVPPGAVPRRRRRCCASRSRNSATWSACRASASTRRCRRCRTRS